MSDNDEMGEVERFRASEIARVQALLDEGEAASGIVDEEPEGVLARNIAKIPHA